MAAQGKQGIVFFLLVILVLVSVGVHELHLSLSMEIPFLALIAVTMTALVATRYMKLQTEGIVIYLLAGIPVLLFVVLVVLLIPDFVQSHTLFNYSR